MSTGERPIQLVQPPRRRRTRAPQKNVLGIDIGGSGLKAALLSPDGEMLTERLRVPTPRPCPPDVLVESLVRLVEPIKDYEFVSVGFPGVVHDGRIITAPNLGTKRLRDFDLAGALEARLGKPVRVLNDADMQGLGAIEGRGVEMVITLGTGFGSALFDHGRLAPHLELAHMPFRKGETFEEQLGERARQRVGKRTWNRRLEKAIEVLRVLVNYEKLYIGGGNTEYITLKLPPNIRIVSNNCGVRGGAWLWRDKSAVRH